MLSSNIIEQPSVCGDAGEVEDDEMDCGLGKEDVNIWREGFH